MKLPFKYIFSVLILVVLCSSDILAQESPTDSLKQSAIDTLDIKSDQIEEEMEADSLSEPMQVKDTTRQEVSQDTVKTAQENPESKTAEAETDSIQDMYRGVGIYIDYLKFASPLISESTKYEAGIEVSLFYGLSLAIEAGYADMQPENALRNGTYQAVGYYGKGGLNYTIIQDKSTRTYVGFRYAITRFDDNGAYNINSELWPDFSNSYSRSDLEARWYEFVIGTEGRLLGNLYMGWFFRYRLLDSFPVFEVEKTFVVPGYGQTITQNKPAVNLVLKYLIAW